MINAREQQFGVFKVSRILMDAGDLLRFNLKNPLPEQHLGNRNMVAKGSITVAIEDYTGVSGVGDGVQYDFRPGQTPFAVGSTVTLTATEPTIYVCVRRVDGGNVGFENVTYGAATNFPLGSVVIPTAAYTANGKPFEPGTPVLIVDGSNLRTEIGVRVGLFFAA